MISCTCRILCQSATAMCMTSLKLRTITEARQCAAYVVMLIAAGYACRLGGVRHLRIIWSFESLSHSIQLGPRGQLKRSHRNSSPCHCSFPYSISSERCVSPRLTILALTSARQFLAVARPQPASCRSSFGSWRGSFYCRWLGATRGRQSTNCCSSS